MAQDSFLFITHWMDGKIPVSVPKDDVDLAKLYVQEGKPHMEIAKMFLAAYRADDPKDCRLPLGKKCERATAVVGEAERQLGVQR